MISGSLRSFTYSIGLRSTRRALRRLREIDLAASQMCDYANPLFRLRRTDDV